MFLIAGSLKNIRISVENLVRSNTLLEGEKSGRLEHVYHLVLALARLNLVNPETLKDRLSERKDNYEYATKVFSETKRTRREPKRK